MPFIIRRKRSHLIPVYAVYLFDALNSPLINAPKMSNPTLTVPNAIFSLVDKLAFFDRLGLLANRVYFLPIINLAFS